MPPAVPFVFGWPEAVVVGLVSAVILAVLGPRMLRGLWRR